MYNIQILTLYHLVVKKKKANLYRKQQKFLGKIFSKILPKDIIEKELFQI